MYAIENFGVEIFYWILFEAYNQRNNDQHPI